MDAIINLQGIAVHVGYYRQGRLWKVDDADCYVTDDRGRLIAAIDDVDALGAWTPSRSWLSLRSLAEMHADENAEAWDRKERQQAQADAIAARRVA